MNPRKRFALLLPTLGLGPLVYVLGGYLAGYGLYPGAIGFLVSMAGMILIPAIISAAFYWTVQAVWAVRALIYLLTLGLQGVLFFQVPSAAECVTIGTAHGLRHEYPIDQVRQCAVELRQKFREGTLVLRDEANGYHFGFGSDAVVAESMLSNSLLGRFKKVLLRHDRESGDIQIIFVVEEYVGILCDSGQRVRNVRIYSMADGIHAYRLQRL